MANRTFYGVYQVGIAAEGSANPVAIHGLQSMAMTTSFNLEQVFEIGQISIYENIENLPEVEVTMEKVLDGYCPIYLLATNGAPAATMSGRSSKKCNLFSAIFQDTQDSASGTPIAEVVCSGLFIGSYGYTFPVDGNFTENVTLTGNNKLWRTSADYQFSGVFNNTDEPIGIGGVNRRENLLFYTTTHDLDVNSQIADSNATILPGGTNGVPGIASSGVNHVSSEGVHDCHVQNISCTTDFGREDLLELGRKTAYFKFANFPQEVTCDIEIIATQGDLISHTEAGFISPGVNLVNKSIRIATMEGLRINLGTKNKLSNVSLGGADAGGGNMTVTYTYTNFNDFTVTHSGDVTTALRNAHYELPAGAIN